MHRNPRNAVAGAQRGLTLIEMVAAMVLVAIIVAATVYFASPVREAADVTVRASLTDTADNALQRISRDVRLALPNSVRMVCANLCVELIPLRTAGRYRGSASGAGCDQGGDAGGSDELSFDVADGCFKSIGTLPNANSIVANPGSLASNDFLVLNNYGAGFGGQDAYATAGTLNRAQLSQAQEQGGARERLNYVAPVSFGSVIFSRTLHDSPGRRFYIVTTPVAYVCDLGLGELRRYSGYTYGQAYTSGSGTLIASDVTGCQFDYVSNVTAQTGLLTVSLTLSKVRTAEFTETVTLYQSVHVSNVP